jgi:hypothetical protein
MGIYSARDDIPREKQVIEFADQARVKSCIQKESAAFFDVTVFLQGHHQPIVPVGLLESTRKARIGVLLCQLFGFVDQSHRKGVE